MKLMDNLNKRPWIISLFIILALSAWIASGSMDAREKEQVASEEAEENPVLKVRVRSIAAKKIDRSIVLYGRTEPNRSTTLKAETSGQVVETLTQRGARVNLNDPILRLAMNDRETRLEHAKAQLAQRQLEYEGAKSLSTKGFQGKTQLAERNALLKESRALVASLQRDIANTLVTAPFKGVLLDRQVEVGDYVAIGDPVAEVVDLDPLIVRGDLNQADVSLLSVGQAARVTLSNGNQYDGTIRYLASLSDESTNTFRVEVSLPNPGYKLFGGLSAELEIPLDQVMAIKISPALLALNEEGVIGVKWVKNNRVQFTPIDVVRNDVDGTWIQGLDDHVELITVGQAFVRACDEVQTVAESGE